MIFLFTVSGIHNSYSRRVEVYLWEMNAERRINAMYASGLTKPYIILPVYNNVAVIPLESINFPAQTRNFSIV